MLIDDDTRSALIVAEYNQLKAEQQARMTTRDRFMYWILAALAGAFTVSTIDTALGQLSLLAVPFISFNLGWTYLRNNHKIAAIGRYLAQRNPNSWETHRVYEPGRRRQKMTHLFVVINQFVGSGFLALIVFWMSHPYGFAWWLSFAEVGMLLFLLAEFTMRADLWFKIPNDKRG